MKFVNPLPFVAISAVRKGSTLKCYSFGYWKIMATLSVSTMGLPFTKAPHCTKQFLESAGDEDAPYGRRNLVLYFENEDLDAAFNRIAEHVDLIHEVRRQFWGQRVFRFFDPDGHIIEIGEPM